MKRFLVYALVAAWYLVVPAWGLAVLVTELGRPPDGYFPTDADLRRALEDVAAGASASHNIVAKGSSLGE